jgi:Uma2 family endonuclease
MDLSTSIPPVTIEAPCTVRPLRRSEYDRLVRAGTFQDERIELLEGMLIPMSPQGAPHASVIELLTEILAHALYGRARVRVQLPFAASDISEPEPDLAVVRRDARRDDHPSQASLLIEVADSESRRERERKVRIYARADVPELWFIDLPAEAVTVYREPSGDRFLKVEQHGRESILGLASFPDVTVPLAELFPSD